MAVTLVSNILKRAREAADAADMTNFANDELLIGWLNVEQVELTLLLAKSSYVLPTLATTVTADGSDSYTIPEPICVVSVHWINNDGQSMVRLKPDHLAASYPVLPGRPVAQCRPSSYFLSVRPGGVVDLRFTQRPSSGQFVVTTIPVPATITSVTDTVDFPITTEEWLVLKLAHRIVAKEEGDTRELKEQIKARAKYIEERGWSMHFLDTPTWSDGATEERQEAWFF